MQGIGTDGRDIIHGGSDNDTIEGLRGNDFLNGHGGDDHVEGGLGNDTIHGGNGEDALYGDSLSEVITPTTLIPVVESGTITVTFEGETAGYRNSFGYYKVDESGAIGETDIIWANASLQGSGGSLIGGEASHDIAVESGDQVGFFIVSNGASYNAFHTMQDGHFEFRAADGSQAEITDTAPTLWHVGDDGAATRIKWHTYHTAGHADTVALNPDGLLHTVGVFRAEEGTFTIGFEDLFRGGDRDFDDSVFTVDMGTANAQVLNAHYETSLAEEAATVIGNRHSVHNPQNTADRIHGQNGADYIEGQAGNDLLAGGGAGSEWQFKNGEWVYVGLPNDADGSNKPLDESDDVILGGTGKDVLLGGRGDDTLSGEGGDDTLNAGEGDDVASGGTGDDILNGDGGNDTLNGDEGDDTANGGDGQDTIDGGAGNDTLNGGADSDKIDGGEGNDHVNGGAGDDVLTGGAGKDKVNGGAGDDQVSGGEGDDGLCGNAGDDAVDGGAGNDTVSGNGGNDVLTGGEGRDTLMGGSGADIANGGADADKVVGGTGADTIIGGAGNDHLWGGNWSADGAADVFVFDRGTGKDWVHDFEAAHDSVDLTGFQTNHDDVFAALEQASGGVSLDLASLGGDQGDQVFFKNASLDMFSEDNLML